MALRIAALFGCPLRELWQRVTPDEFALWVAFYKDEPWGYRADNYHAGLISSTIANHSGQSEAVPPSFFMDNENTPAPIPVAEATEDEDAEIARMMRVLER